MAQPVISFTPAEARFTQGALEAQGKKKKQQHYVALVGLGFHPLILHTQVVPLACWWCISFLLWLLALPPC